MASIDTKSENQKEDAKSTPDGSRVVTAVFIGAILGGVWGWLYLTPRGNTVRDRVDPAVDRIVDALEKVQSLRSIVKSLAVLVLAIGCLSLPTTARADTFFVPWIGGNAGAPTGAGAIGFGGSLGWSTVGIVDVDVDSGYSPSDAGVGVRRSLFTTMGDVTIGIPFGRRGAPRLRPYLTGGAGVIRSRAQAVPIGYDVTHYGVGVAFGGGLAVYTTRHLGARADLRYIRGSHNTMSDDPFGELDARPHYWRTSIGLVIR